MASSSLELLVGAGCFWSVEGTLRLLVGLEGWEVGYIHLPWEGKPPLLEGDGQERHRAQRVEVLRVQWDPSRLPPDALLQAFWAIHIPTLVPADTFSESGNCRSLLVCSDPTTRAALEQGVAAHALQQSAEAPLQTRVYAAAEFQRAGAYDQDYFRKRPTDGFSCSIIAPKVARLQALLPAYLRAPA